MSDVAARISESEFMFSLRRIPSARCFASFCRELIEVTIRIGELHHEPEMLGAVAGRKGINRYCFTVADEHRLAQARLARHRNGYAFEAPGGDLAIGLLHIEVDINVWVDPLDLRDHAFQRD